MYTTVLADPPWTYADPLTMSTVKRGAASNYPTMDVQAICDLYQSSQVRHLITGQRGNYVKQPGQLAGYDIADDAFLFLCVTNSMLIEGIGTRVANEWGFTPKQLITWVKGRVDVITDTTAQLTLNLGMGSITRNVTEHVLLCTRGKYKHLVQHKGTPNLVVEEEDLVILEPRTKHSTKPEGLYRLIERVVPGPRLELFARREREGWTTWGHDVGRSHRVQVTDDPICPEPPYEWP